MGGGMAVLFWEVRKNSEFAENKFQDSRKLEKRFQEIGKESEGVEVAELINAKSKKGIIQ